MKLLPTDRILLPGESPPNLTWALARLIGWTLLGAAALPCIAAGLLGIAMATVSRFSSTGLLVLLVLCGAAAGARVARRLE